MNRNVSFLTVALIAGVISAFPQWARADSQRPSAQVPPGWTAREGRGGSQYYVPPGATGMDVYEAIFPTQKLNGTLEQTSGALWHTVIGGERLVDSKTRRITATDGAPAYEVLVATVDRQNQGVYRIFVFKQYGQSVAVGELRFNDVDRIKMIGKPAVASLENMSAQAGAITPYQAGTITPYHAHLITPAPPGGVEVSNRKGGFSGALAGTWVLKVPGVAYTTSVDYGAYTQNTLHVSPGAAAGYLRIAANRRYVWYGSDGKAVSSGRLVQIVPRRDAAAGHTYWRVFEGREEHYLTLDGDGGISIYDPATNMVSMEGYKH
ncbi:MAG TPA: hypothetical protein VFN37_04605 [Candidatus Baltobacteraceae bacterium]|nr:hypothetical protein [Candidatus Baltobacteraceae bacterium]